MKKYLFLFVIISASISFYYQLKTIDAAHPWRDEQATQRDLKHTIADIFNGKADPVHTPGYLLLLKMITLAPSNLYTFRVLSAICFLISLKLLFLLGSSIKNQEFGYIICGSYAYSLYFFNFNWQARMYAISLVFIIYSLLILSRMGRNPSRTQLVSFTITNFIGLYLDYTFIWYLTPLTGIYFFKALFTHSTLDKTLIKSLLASFLGFIMLYPEIFLNISHGLERITWTSINLIPSVFLSKFFGGKTGSIFLFYNLFLSIIGTFLIFYDHPRLPKKIVICALSSAIATYLFSLIYTPLFHVRSLQIVGLAILFSCSTTQYYLYQKNRLYYLLSTLPVIISFFVHLTTNPYWVL
jgi:hypothetical protein